MKNLLLIAVMIIFALVSCQDKKAKSENNELQSIQSENHQLQIELGEKLYTENICNACHLNDRSDLGPSTKQIVEKYKEQEKSIVSFLQGKVEPFVDTDEDQVAIMQMNLDTFVAKLSLSELEAIEAYMINAVAN